MYACRLFVFVLSMWFITDAHSQDLEIFYSAQDESMTFVYGGDTIQRPRVKKYNNIILHVTELNNYLYEVTLDITNEVVNYPTSSSGFQDIIEGESRNLINNDTRSLIFSPPTAFLEEASNKINDLEFDIALGFAGEDSEQTKLENLRIQIGKELDQLKIIEKEIRIEEEKIENILHREKLLQIASNSIENIKLNPTIPTSRIRFLIEQYLTKVFNKPLESLTLDDLITMSQPKLELEYAIDLFDNKIKEYSNSITKINNVSNLIEQLEIEDKEYEEMKFIIEQVSSQANSYENNLYDNKNKLEEIQQELNPADLNSLADLRVVAEEILNNDFTQTFRITAIKDLTHIRINKFSKTGTSNFGGSASLDQQPTLTIPTVGGLKTSASIGFSFSQFFEKQQKFSIEDNTIVAGGVDDFYPILTSYFHFFPRTVGNFTVGGSFGIGLPLLDQQRAQSANFMLGTSLLFGQLDQLILSCGLMGGRKEVLGRDLRIGDSFNGFPEDLPKEYPYDLGLFIGISFNLTSSKF